MSHLKLFLFGPPRLEQAGQPVELSLRKAWGVFVYLAVTRQIHSRDALATLFWPEKDHRTGRANLRRILHRLNQLLPGQVLTITAETIQLNPEAGLWIDTETFRQHLAGCLPPGDAAPDLSPACLSRLATAAGLYTDDFLAGFTLPDCPGFDEWQFFQTESLRRSLTQGLVQLVTAHQARQQFEPALAYARRWLALDPLHEPAHRRLMQLYDQTGQPAAALRQYQECHRLLEAELGLPPAEETTTLYEAIKAKQLLAPFVKPTQRAAEPLSPPHPRTSARSPHPETRYVANGDIHIAYQVLGEGPVDIVFVGGFVSHLEQVWEEPGLARFFERLAAMSRLILFDKRGMGLSDRVGYPPTLENTMDDILTVMQAVDCDQAVLMGVSEGGPNSALFAATYPEKVAALILFGTTARFTRSPDYPWALTAEQFDKWLDYLVTNWGGPLSLEFFAPSQAGEAEFRQWWAKLLRLASSPSGIRAVLEVAKEIDVRHILPAIRVPTLILHRTGDRMMSVEGGRYLAQHIPNAKYVELAGPDHWWWVGEVETLLTEIDTFLKDLQQPIPFDQILATILLVEITGPAPAANDGAYQAALEQEINRFRGRLIRRDKTRWLATFDGPSRAIRCALGLKTVAQASGLIIRAGLHTGECQVTAQGISGAAVQIALNMLEHARPGQIIISNTVKDLVVGAGFSFEECGLYHMSGTPGEWRLFALR